VVEPDRLPLPLLHWLAGSSLPPPSAGRPDRVWDEVPRFVVPLRERLRRLSGCMDESGEFLSGPRLDRTLAEIQQQQGESYWSVLDYQDPLWLERVYADVMETSSEEVSRPSCLSTKGSGICRPPARERWSAKFGQVDKWRICLRAAMMPRIRSDRIAATGG